MFFKPIQAFSFNHSLLVKLTVLGPKSVIKNQTAFIPFTHSAHGLRKCEMSAVNNLKAANFDFWALIPYLNWQTMFSTVIHRKKITNCIYSFNICLFES